VTLVNGLNDSFDATAQLRRHTLDGVEGPSGSGVVAFGALPFDRSANGQLRVPEFCITQYRDGDAWLSTLEGSTQWTALLDETTAPVQEAQSLRSLTMQPTPDDTPTTSRSPWRYCAPKRSTSGVGPISPRDRARADRPRRDRPATPRT